MPDHIYLLKETDNDYDADETHTYVDAYRNIETARQAINEQAKEVLDGLTTDSYHPNIDRNGDTLTINTTDNSYQWSIESTIIHQKKTY